MAKPKITPSAISTPPKAPPVDRLPWPVSAKDLPGSERTFRIHRLNAFEWQAFVFDGVLERPIGKPDLFEILSKKIAGVMRAEGQAEFMAAKLKTETRVADAQ